MNGNSGPGPDDFGARLRSALRDEDLEVPAEAMWEAIVAGRTQRRARWPWRLGWGLAASAVLALAVGLGREIGPWAPNGDGVTPLETVAPSGAHAVAPGRYAWAAAHHFREAETLLALFRTERPDVSGETGRWAQSLLGTTRLLMDSPARSNPDLAETLDDLELVLVQIAGLDPALPAAERRWVEESLENRHLMSRLRALGLDPTGRGTTTMEDL